MLSMHELSLSMPEPMSSQSMLILEDSDQVWSKSWTTKSVIWSNDNEQSEMVWESTF